MTAGIPVQDPSTGTMATPQSQIALRRTVVLTEAASQEESGCPKTAMRVTPDAQAV